METSVIESCLEFHYILSLMPTLTVNFLPTLVLNSGITSFANVVFNQHILNRSRLFQSHSHHVFPGLQTVTSFYMLKGTFTVHL